MEKPHKKLEVWKQSVSLCTQVYRLTEGFPKHELYGLASQMRRASVSIPSNLAEGAARNSPKEFAQFINIARGSLSELDTQVEIAYGLSYLSAQQQTVLDNLMNTVDKMLYGLWRKHRLEGK